MARLQPSEVAPSRQRHPDDSGAGLRGDRDRKVAAGLGKPGRGRAERSNCIGPEPHRYPESVACVEDRLARRSDRGLLLREIAGHEVQIGHGTLVRPNQNPRLLYQATCPLRRLEVRLQLLMRRQIEPVRAHRVVHRTRRDVVSFQPAGRVGFLGGTLCAGRRSATPSTGEGHQQGDPGTDLMGWHAARAAPHTTERQIQRHR